MMHETQMSQFDRTLALIQPLPKRLTVVVAPHLSPEHGWNREMGNQLRNLLSKLGCEVVDGYWYGQQATDALAQGRVDAIIFKDIYLGCGKGLDTWIRGRLRDTEVPLLSFEDPRGYSLGGCPPVRHLQLEDLPDILRQICEKTSAHEAHAGGA